MIRITFAAVGVLALLAGGAIAAPPPNDVGVTGMGGGVYFNPYKNGARPQSTINDRGQDTGTASEGGSVYHAPVGGHG
jgi:hypothetical protein